MFSSSSSPTVTEVEHKIHLKLSLPSSCTSSSSGKEVLKSLNVRVIQQRIVQQFLHEQHQRQKQRKQQQQQQWQKWRNWQQQLKKDQHQWYQWQHKKEEQQQQQQEQHQDCFPKVSVSSPLALSSSVTMSPTTTPADVVQSSSSFENNDNCCDSNSNNTITCSTSDSDNKTLILMSPRPFPPLHVVSRRKRNCRLPLKKRNHTHPSFVIVPLSSSSSPSSSPSSNKRARK